MCIHVPRQDEYLKGPKECAQKLPAEALDATHSLLEGVVEEQLNGKHATVV